MLAAYMYPFRFTTIETDLTRHPFITAMVVFPRYLTIILKSVFPSLPQNCDQKAKERFIGFKHNWDSGPRFQNSPDSSIISRVKFDIMAPNLR